MDSPVFLLNKEPDLISGTTLEQLEELVTVFCDLEEQIKEQEATLAVTKALFKTVAQESIPTLLNQHGLSEIRLRGGSKIVVKEDASVSVPDNKKLAFFEFLKTRDEEDIIKLQVQFKQMTVEKQHELFDFLNNYDYEYEAERGVHPMTLKSYFKKLLGIGDEARAEGVASGKYMKVQDITSIVNVYTFFNTKIK